MTNTTTTSNGSAQYEQPEMYQYFEIPDNRIRKRNRVLVTAFTTVALVFALLGTVYVANKSVSSSSAASTSELFKTASDNEVDECPVTANVWITLAGERKITGNEYSARPLLSRHRDVLGWGDEKIDQMWRDASDFFENNWGVKDVYNWPIVSSFDTVTPIWVYPPVLVVE